MPCWRLFYHIVWSTKGREPWLVGERAALAEWALRHRMREPSVYIHGLSIMPDHVHVAVSIPPDARISSVVQCRPADEGQFELSRRRAGRDGSR